MKMKIIPLLIAGLVSHATYAKHVDSFFCPQTSSNVQVGMTVDEVLKYCGQPQGQNAPDQPILKNVPVTRLNYNNLNRGPLYFWKLDNVYNLFSQPSGGQTNRLNVLIVDNKIKTIMLNGAEVKSTDACSQIGSTNYAATSSPTPDSTLNVGDNASAVINSCGSPDLEDQSYMQVPVPKAEQPLQWIYQTDQYHPSYTLTFIKGILQSIESDSQ